MKGRAEIGAAATRVAAALREHSGETPRTFEFLVSDDKSVRAIDQVTSTGSRVLLLEAYRGMSAVLNQIAAVRRDGPIDAVWFADGMSARDEGVALSAIEEAIDVQLTGTDLGRHPADVLVDVRPGRPDPIQPYLPRYTAAQYAATLTTGPLSVAFWAYLLAWICYGVGMLLAPEPPAVAVVALVGMLVAQLVASIALGTAGVVGRSGNAVAVMVVAFTSVILTPIAVAPLPVGPIVAWAGGLLMVVGAMLAAGVPRHGRVAPVAFAAVGGIGVAVAAGVAETPSVATSVVTGSMVLATVAAGGLLRRGMRRAAAGEPAAAASHD